MAKDDAFPTTADSQSLAQLHLLVASELSVKVRHFIRRVMENDEKNSKKIGWNDFRDMLPILTEYDARNWLRILSSLERRKGEYHFFAEHTYDEIPSCPSCRTKKVAKVPVIAHAVVASIKPWERSSIYLPFLQAVQAGPQSIFVEGSADVLGNLAFAKGGRLPNEKKRATGLFEFMKGKSGTFDKETTKKISEKLKPQAEK